MKASILEGRLQSRANVKEIIARVSEEVQLGEMNSKVLHDWELVLRSSGLKKGISR